jgi:hypothetical protein
MGHTPSTLDYVIVCRTPLGLTSLFGISTICFSLASLQCIIDDVLMKVLLLGDCGTAQSEIINKVIKTQLPMAGLYNFCIQFLGVSDKTDASMDDDGDHVIWSDITIGILQNLLNKKLTLVSTRLDARI